MGLFRSLHHYLVPHAGNNHRAKALHHDALLAYVLLFAVFNLGIKFIHRQAPDVLGYATDIRVERLFADINAERVKGGLTPLTLNTELSQAAAAKAADMFANNYWAHNSPQGKTPWDFIIGSGYRYRLAGENLAKNFSDSDGVVSAWMASPSHRANIMKPEYRDIGFAVVNGKLDGEEMTLVVQMFGTSAAAVAEVPKVRAPEPVTEQKTVVLEEPAAREAQPVPPVAPAKAGTGLTLAGVKVSPLVNISGLTREVTYLFVGLIIGVLAVDAYVVSRKKVVRLAGHNVTHILFLATVVISGLAVTRGILI